MIRHQKGHKNSKGEKAEWVIVSHKDGHIISSHTSKAAAEKHLKDIQKFKHMKESAEDGHISRWDRRKIFNAIAPSWAKKVSVLGPKPKRPDTANTPSEVAMRRVTDPKYRKYTETDLLNDRNAEKDANQRIANIIAKKIDLPISATSTSIIIEGDGITYEIIPYGFVYKVRTRKNNTDTEMYDFESINDIIEFIKNDTLGESMKLAEAKEILKKNGAKLVKENHEDDIRANDEAFNFLYALESDFAQWFKKIESKANDYTNGHVSNEDWNEFIEKYENAPIVNKISKIGDILRTIVNR